MKIQIYQGRLIDPASHTDTQTDIYIQDGTIIALGQAPDGFVADTVLDATGLWVCPGLVDMSARLRETGQEDMATIDSETRAAVAGGITSLCIPPDTEPLIDTPASVELIEERSKRAGRTKVYPLGALTQQLAGERLTEMAALKAAGCIGFSNGAMPIANTQVLRRAMEYAASLELTLFIQAAEPWLYAQGCIHEGAVSTRLGLNGIPETAETIALARDLLLIEQIGVKTHFHNISTAKAVDMIHDAQSRGLPVTADISIHHLHLSEHDIGHYDSFTHVMPPLRTIRDREQLQQGVREGVITAICSDHKPLDSDAKLGPFAETIPGISGLETLLALTLKLVEDGELSLRQAITALSYQPAQILGLDAGQIKVGALADICLIDPDAHWTCQPEQLISAGKNTPFGGWLFTHQVQYTLLNGEIIYRREPQP